MTAMAATAPTAPAPPMKANSLKGNVSTGGRVPFL
jgi:hypothetical protein